MLAGREHDAFRRRGITLGRWHDGRVDPVLDLRGKKRRTCGTNARDEISFHARAKSREFRQLRHGDALRSDGATATPPTLVMVSLA
jgi:hypothetical protein